MNMKIPYTFHFSTFLLATFVEYAKKKTAGILQKRSPNVVKFKYDLSRSIARNPSRKFSVLALEIENINEIHRYLGCKAGNEAINFIKKRARTFFKGCEVYSIFYNEISIVIPCIDEYEACSQGVRFMENYAKPVRINNRSIKINMFCGIVNYPNHGKTSKEIFQKMGRTLTQSKIDHRTVSIYDSKITSKIKNDYCILNNIREAVEKNELRLVYHPKIDIVKNRIVGAEALLRWDNHKNINIAEMIEVSENVGYITDISKAVIDIVIKQMEEWKKEGMEIKVAINISPLDLMNDVLYDHLVERFKKSTVKPEMLELEITERNTYREEDKVLDMLNKLKKLGLGITMDDFGTGFNSLKYILKFPIDTIKIDKYFIDTVEDNNTKNVIEGINNTARQTGMVVIAEGVETKSQIQALENIGCRIIQGYYFSKPLNPESFKEYYNEYGHSETKTENANCVLSTVKKCS
ncbi:EAL domain, c-di-GMP-specific phosphodiesterase class I (or its enzymatically inactive variant) [Dethiosulfatibacter aminovorans DSM 17477]|uniref:EAL domain, c-di-GMP-specific phosphodiesterase class I (Or its enzymatically inactive variant) n=1 Tax=Dethiosulfatibacter aminovorans DSM 17477 TaxID=1121476 RepID=A0A1M6IJ34_9FIRM|nr:EAL domain-containing protein [Dethiosulfatibacter aminovorans]SHJ34454.1 EAL domain, c-di-GMP-specific phosphodiesterase class I (or its enzymatically inactive variant) [Dethiosulfatibacter aminovorans DSM 17477]